MSKSTDSIVRIIKAGGNLSVDAQGKSTDSLVRIVKVAVKEDKQITLRNLDGKSTDSLIRIVKHGGNNVILEV